ncbi:hypothetical protein HPB48_002371 [Haemaphysalis longicornis]|uniref:Kazal-like domain-containing protein n=1 Tax=Haemaphysalis longicornis TaxID=44386 RepID=A0A9J6GIJ6_HAELO|nr:hypothetical protein HPB48_002371 [Haemaphysalis longicornis]
MAVWALKSYPVGAGMSSSSLSSLGDYKEVCLPPEDVAPPPEPKRKISLTLLPFITKPLRERDVRCGWGSFRPDFLLNLRHPRTVLVALCCMVFLQGFVANGLVYMVLPTLERRFQLKSLEAGIIVAMYHLASCISAPLVTLVAARRSKPLYLAMSAIVIGIGTMVITLPHFLAPPYKQSLLEVDLCPYKVRHDYSDGCGTATGDLRHYRFVFWAGHLIVGAGSSPMYTLALTYLDENLPTTLSTKYIGELHAPSAGVSGDVRGMGLTPESNVWIGAWWLGYLIGSVFSIIVAFPTSLLPKELPCQMWAKLEKKYEAVANKAPKKKELSNKLKDLPARINALLHNTTYMFLCMAATAESSVAVPGACGGILLGGYCVHRLQLATEGIVRMCLLCSVIPWLSCFVLLYSCPSPSFFGLNHTSSRFSVANVSNQFDQPCNAHCGCPIEHYDPICGKDMLTYYSPCFAGCRRDYIYGSFKVYTDCQCISHAGVETMVLWGIPERIQADRKKCIGECNALYAYLTGIFLYMCVEENLKALSLGFQWMMLHIYAIEKWHMKR